MRLWNMPTLLNKENQKGHTLAGERFLPTPQKRLQDMQNYQPWGKKGNPVYSKIDGLGKEARKQLEKVFDGKVIVTGKGSLFMTHFIKDEISQIKNAADGAISNAHSNSDIKNMINVSSRFSSTL